MNTPSHHRVHHATNPRYLDAYYAGTLIIWDRMFGTFVVELPQDMPRYGLVRNIATFNPFKVAIHEWESMFKDAAQPDINLSTRLASRSAAIGFCSPEGRIYIVASRGSR